MEPLMKRLGKLPPPHLSLAPKPMAKHHPNNDPFREVKFVTLFVPLLPSLELKTCPSGHPNIIFNSGLESIDASIENKTPHAMDIHETPTLESKRRDSTNENESFTFEIPHGSCSILKSPEFVSLSITSFYEGHNHLLILIYKLFNRMVVDAFIYHKFCNSRGYTVILTLQLEL